MLDTYQIIGIFIFGVVFLVSGIVAVSKKRITFRFRRGTIRPSMEGVLEGTPALIYGGVALISGLLMIFPILLSIFGAFDRDSLVITSIAGIGLFMIGLVLSSIIQIAVSWGERIGKHQ